MSVKTETIACPYCEGTGRELNYFDPPVVERRKPMTIFGLQRTISGREILDEHCSACNGTKKIAVIK
ncbi:hypothetical protein COE79_20670 [Bacillus toyonensis]|uniref:hypothetical protein n=1 Tax=Bacillus toyonensis TaxID=155322 RepID=UPI000BFC4698|nr:hypothetical protein [Bacillus toyonensis]PHA98706.1 hypothetical protein COE79_20670 [Bacillus toyonensis]